MPQSLLDVSFLLQFREEEMSVFRVEKTNNYTVMSNFHLREKNMSLKAKGLLSWMLSNDDSWDYSISGIVKNCKESESAITTALKELEEFGYLERIKHYPDEKHNNIWYEYIIHEQAYDFQPIDNQAIENPPQRSNKQINTKKERTNSIELVEPQNFLGSVPKTKKQSLYGQCISLMDEFILKHNAGNNIKSLLIQYLNLRLEMKDRPIYANQWKGLLNKLEEIHKQGLGYEPIIRQSIERGYASFYPINNKSTRLSEDGVVSNHYTKEELEKLNQAAEKLEAQGKQAYF